MGRAGRAEDGRTEGNERPQGGEAQAVEELQRAWADHRRRQEGVERAEREEGRQEERKGQEGTPLVPFRQPAIPPEQEEEMQERAWRRIRGEAEKWKGTGRWRRGSAGCGRRGRRWPGGPTGSSRIRKGTPSTDVEGRSPSGKRAREEEEEAGQCNVLVLSLLTRSIVASLSLIGSIFEIKMNLLLQ